jgi:hypothetical protein
MGTELLAAMARKVQDASRRHRRRSNEFRDAFEKHYGHGDISDVLVEAMDYGAPVKLTPEFIDLHSGPGHS